MCGICGIVDFADDRKIETGTLRAMTEKLRHRGPDDWDIFIDGPVGLGHTRLSIIDLTQAGHQPMQTGDGTLTLTYNGEIYNFQALRRELEDAGCTFRSRTDTEVILQAYLIWGTDAFLKFNGMFAFALWDARTEQMFLVRDRFGIKPLYYISLPHGLVFGSEIKSILASGQLQRRINWQALHEYLYFGNALGTHTMYDEINELLPGHYLVMDRTRTRIVPFWPAVDLKPAEGSVTDMIAGIGDRLEKAVQRHLISDVPVGIFLSGGIDSSAIAAFAHKHYQDTLMTFSVRFDFDRGVNELPQARKIAELYGTDHHELNVAGADITHVIEHLVQCHDEPFADAANIPLYLLCEQIKGSVKVVLQGDGGDEMFAGYRRYAALARLRLWRLIAQSVHPFSQWLPAHPQTERLLRFLRTFLPEDPALRMALLLTVETRESPPTRMLSSDAYQMIHPCDPFIRYREVSTQFSLTRCNRCCIQTV